MKLSYVYKMISTPNLTSLDKPIALVIHLYFSSRDKLEYSSRVPLVLSTNRSTGDLCFFADFAVFAAAAAAFCVFGATPDLKSQIICILFLFLES